MEVKPRYAAGQTDTAGPSVGLVISENKTPSLPERGGPRLTASEPRPTDRRTYRQKEDRSRFP